MNNLTKFQINRPAQELYEAFVDPEKIGNFWFSTSSSRWVTNTTVTLTYAEYGAEFDIRVLEAIPNEKIVFLWGEGTDEHRVTISLAGDGDSTVIAVHEEGFREDDPELIAKLVDNKEGWVFMLSCLKVYLEHGVSDLRGSIVW